MGLSAIALMDLSKAIAFSPQKPGCFQAKPPVRSKTDEILRIGGPGAYSGTTKYNHDPLQQ